MCDPLGPLLFVGIGVGTNSLYSDNRLLHDVLSAIYYVISSLKFAMV